MRQTAKEPKSKKTKQQEGQRANRHQDGAKALQGPNISRQCLFQCALSSVMNAEALEGKTAIPTECEMHCSKAAQQKFQD